MEHFIPFLLFAISSSITPGPNNIMLMSSGVNFGVKRSLPHFFGILFGFPAFLLVIGLGLGALFTQHPFFHELVKYVGAFYMLYLAWHIAMSHSQLKNNADGKPITFFRALLFQWVNPKAWVMGVGAFAAYTSIHGNAYKEVILICLTYLLILIPSGCSWLLFGTSLKRILKNDQHQRWFNYAMGATLAVSVILIFVE